MGFMASASESCWKRLQHGVHVPFPNQSYRGRPVTSTENRIQKTEFRSHEIRIADRGSRICKRGTANLKSIERLNRVLKCAWLEHRKLVQLTNTGLSCAGR